MRSAYKMFVRKPAGRDHAEDLVIDGKILLKWILGKQGRRAWSGLTRFTIGTGGWFSWTRE
jgi:hypothetical protein